MVFPRSVDEPLEPDALRGSGLNLYRQLVGELERAIEAGKLKDGERLPSEKKLAAQLGLSRTTVINSYQKLESRGGSTLV